MSLQSFSYHAMLLFTQIDQGYRVMETDKLMTAKQVSDYLGVAKLTLQNWRTTGIPVLPFIKIGRVVRYSEIAVIKFLEGNTMTKC